MRTTNRAPTREDLTARACIRDVAIRLFAERGEGGTTFRGVAKAAGVSPGLVQHHFPSKGALREACDRHVLEMMRAQSKVAVAEHRLADPTYVNAAYAGAPLVQRYLARVLVDGSPAAAMLFGEIVRLSEQYLRKAGGASKDPANLRAQGAVLAAMKLGLAVFHEQIARSLGLRDAGKANVSIARATLDLLSPQMMGRDVVAQARAGLDGYERANATGTPRRSAQRRATRA